MPRQIILGCNNPTDMNLHESQVPEVDRIILHVAVGVDESFVPAGVEVVVLGFYSWKRSSNVGVLEDF